MLYVHWSDVEMFSCLLMICVSEAEAEDGPDDVEHPSSFETDSKVLERREKQIGYGVGTSEYQNYRKQVPL